MSIIDAVMGKNMAIEELSKNGGIGYTEPAKVFTCDGNPNGENVYDGAYRISTKVLDLTTVTSLTFVNGGQPVTMTKEEFISMGGEVSSEHIGGDGMGYLACTVHTDGDRPVGTYVWCGEEGYVSCIEFAEIAHPIDPKYLSDAMPKIVDLSEFETTFDNGRVDISTLILLLMAASTQSDGALQDVRVPDENLALRKALTTNRHVLLRMYADDTISTIPTIIMKNKDTDMAVQAAASALFFMGGSVIDMKVIFLYNVNPDDTEVRILVQAKVIAA